MAVNPHIRSLFDKYLESSITQEEYQELLRFSRESEDESFRHLFREAMSNPDATATSRVPEAVLDQVSETVAGRLQQTIRIKPKFIRPRLLPYAAACILILFSVSLYWMVQRSDNRSLVSVYGDDVLPGTNRATITLADGSRFELSEAKEGVQIHSDGIQYDDGSVIASELEVTTATISTPNGGQYRITLPDGTKVILNAATSLTYPSRFVGGERLVTLDGEAYFEVAHLAHQPFRVKSRQQELEVLGTKFNASTYHADKTVTTLIEGSVQLRTDQAKVILNPGQQSVLENHKFNVQPVSTDDYVSWVHNQFVFNNMPLEEVFAHLERWYDVSFDYPKELVHQRIYAEITRDRNLSEVLNTLEEVVDLTFKIEGRRVSVRK